MALRPSKDHTMPNSGRFTVFTEAFDAYAGDPGTVENTVFCRVVVEPSAPRNGAISEWRTSPIRILPHPTRAQHPTRARLQQRALEVVHDRGRLGRLLRHRHGHHPFLWAIDGAMLAAAVAALLQPGCNRGWNNVAWRQRGRSQT